MDRLVSSPADARAFVQDLNYSIVVQTQPRKHALDRADYTAATRQHELDHTDLIDDTDQGTVYLEISRS